ncbi:hypothetical protein, partial [Escherichia coli]
MSGNIGANPLGNMLNDFVGVDQQRVMHCRKAFSDAKVFK